MAMEKSVESSLDVGIALVESVIQDLRNGQAEIAEFDKEIEKAAGLANLAITKSKELAESLGAAPESMQEAVLGAVQAPIDSVVTDFQNNMDELEQELVKVLQNEGGHEAVLNAVRTATDLTAALEQNVIERKDELLATSAAAEAALQTFVSAFGTLSDGFQNKIESLFQEFETFIESEIVEPITQEGERLAEEWSDLVTSELTDLVEETMQKVSESIEAPVAQAIEALEDAATREIEALRELLTTGNDTTDVTRAALEEAIDTIKSAIEPLEAAFDAFKGLAGTVGVEL